MAFSDDKAALLALVKAKKCRDMQYVAQVANDYPDFLSLAFEYAQTFDCDTDYLESLLAVIDDTQMVANAMYYNKVLVNITNARFVAKTSITTLTLTQNKNVEIVDGSHIGTLVVTSLAQIDRVTVSSNSIVDLIQVDSGAAIDALLIKACGVKFGTVTKINSDSQVNNIIQDATAVFGGFDCPTILT